MCEDCFELPSSGCLRTSSCWLTRNSIGGMPRAGREGSSPNQFKKEAPLLWGFLQLEPGQWGPTVPGTGFLKEMLLLPVNLRAELVNSSGSRGQSWWTVWGAEGRAGGQFRETCTWGR